MSTNADSGPAVAVDAHEPQESVVRPSVCRVCVNSCGVLVETQGSRVLRVIGDRENPLYRGYSCEKGRAHAGLYDHPQRILKPLKRMPNGDLAEIPLSVALDEISERIRSLVATHGPRSLSIYWGTYFAFDNPANLPICDGFANAIGTPMVFTPIVIDQPGKVVARGFHGMWMAPARSHEPDVVMMIGHNPLVSHQHRSGNPHALFKEIKRRGAKLIVIDPRRTETASRADLHLQVRPGTDSLLFAGMIRQIFVDGLEDRQFLDENVDGVDALRAAVESATPELVAERCGVSSEDLIRAVRMFAGSRVGYATTGTGPGMGGEGTLVEYLLLCLDTVAGHWMREGDLFPNPLTLLPSILLPGKAQAMPPFPAHDLGVRLRSRDLALCAAGMPTAGLPDEILVDDDNRVRALISMGGNPVNSIPDQPRMHRAIEALDLFVCTDVQMSPTARLADYVIPCKLAYEQVGSSAPTEYLQTMANGLGLADSYAQFSPALVEPPEDAEVIEQWELLWGIAERLGLQIDLPCGFNEALAQGKSVPLDMSAKPRSEDLLDLLFADTRVPLSEIQGHSHGAFFPVEGNRVQPKDDGYEGRLQVGDPVMLTDLDTALNRATDPQSDGYPFRLLCRRSPHVLNSPVVVSPPGAPSYNPAYMNSADLDRLGIADGDIVEISSAYATIVAVAGKDDSLRELMVSMHHSWGDIPDYDKDVRSIGSNPGRLVDNRALFDRFTGQPRMSNIPVRVALAESFVESV